MLTGLTTTTVKILRITITLYLNVPDVLTSVSAGKLKEIAGSILFLAPTLKKMLLFSPR
jgi:hypothetical protein